MAIRFLVEKAEDRLAINAEASQFALTTVEADALELSGFGIDGYFRLADQALRHEINVELDFLVQD